MARKYELVLMLDPEVDDAARDKVASDVRAQIESGGTLEQADNWGMRKMAYEIRQRNEADYRFFRFQGDNALLEGLDHNLKIVDAALRFRIFKVDPDAPTAPPPVSGPAGARARGAPRGCPLRRPAAPAAPDRLPPRLPRRPPHRKLRRRATCRGDSEAPAEPEAPSSRSREPIPAGGLPKCGLFPRSGRGGRKTPLRDLR